ALPVRHRHGRRMGRRSIAGDGARATTMARIAVGNPAERILHRISAGGGGGTGCASDPRLAVDVLDRRCTGAVGAVCPDARTGVGGVATASRADDGGHPRDRRQALEVIRVPGAADDPVHVPLAWNAGPLSRLLEA